MNLNRSNVDMTGNKFCGPLVIAALAGISTGEAAEHVRRSNQNIRSVKGLRIGDLRFTLQKLGLLMYEERIDMREVPKAFSDRTHSAGPTLAEWLRTRSRPTDTHIVVVADHYILVSGRKMVDTWTKGEWTFIGSAPHRRKRVRRVYRIERIDSNVPGMKGVPL